MRYWLFVVLGIVLLAPQSLRAQEDSKYQLILTPTLPEGVPDTTEWRVVATVETTITRIFTQDANDLFLKLQGVCPGEPGECEFLVQYRLAAETDSAEPTSRRTARFAIRRPDGTIGEWFGLMDHQGSPRYWALGSEGWQEHVLPEAFLEWKLQDVFTRSLIELHNEVVLPRHRRQQQERQEKEHKQEPPSMEIGPKVKASRPRHGGVVFISYTDGHDY